MRTRKQQLDAASDDWFEVTLRATAASAIIVVTAIAVVNLPAIVRFLGI